MMFRRNRTFENRGIDRRTIYARACKTLLVLLLACFASGRLNADEAFQRGAETLPAPKKHVAVVTPEAFVRPLEPWLEYRRLQGYAIHLLVEPRRGETTTPEKVRQRIGKLAAEVPLSAVLLVGNGVVRSADRSSDVVPSPVVPCRVIRDFGEETVLASDDVYVDFDGNGIPDAAIGRFPVDTPEELGHLIRKTIRYETEIVPGLWGRRLQLVAGTGNLTPLLDGVIESGVRYVLSETIPPSWELALLHADWKSPFCPSPLDFQDELIESLNSAPMFWAYLGHGHHRMLDTLTTPLGYVPTLSGDALPRLHCREASPIVFLFCCYGGWFDRETPSLAEELIRQPEGPVAVVAASRTTMPYGMSVFGFEMIRQILDERKTGCREEIGTLMLRAKRQMFEERPTVAGNRRSEKPPVRESLKTMARSFDPTASKLPVQLAEHSAMFHLFGDPLLGMPVYADIEIRCPEKVRPGETVRIEGSLDLSPDEENAGSLHLELLPDLNRLTLRSSRRGEFRIDEESRRGDNEEYRNSNGRILLTREVSLKNGGFSVEITIPDFLRGSYVLRAFHGTPGRLFLGAASIHVGGRKR